MGLTNICHIVNHVLAQCSNRFTAARNIGKHELKVRVDLINRCCVSLELKVQQRAPRDAKVKGTVLTQTN